MHAQLQAYTYSSYDLGLLAVLEWKCIVDTHFIVWQLWWLTHRHKNRQLLTGYAISSASW